MAYNPYEGFIFDTRNPFGRQYPAEPAPNVDQPYYQPNWRTNDPRVEEVRTAQPIFDTPPYRTHHQDVGEMPVFDTPRVAHHGNPWLDALAQARADGYKINLRNPRDVAFVKKNYYRFYGPVKKPRAKKRAPARRGSKTPRRKSKVKHRLVPEGRHRSRRRIDGKCYTYSPKHPKFWRENDGECITYATHKKRRTRGKGGDMLVGGYY